MVPVKGAGAAQAVTPSKETVLGGTYTPLSRPIFIYVNKDSLKTKPLVAKFVRYYLENAPTLSEEVGYVPLPQSEYEAGLNKI